MGTRTFSRRYAGLLLGPVLFTGVLLAPVPSGMEMEAWRTIALALLMATWWITEAIPIPATALLPVVLLPILGVSGLEAATSPYANPLIFLFLGGFVIAAGMQRWNLHQQVALAIVGIVGAGPQSIVIGFSIAAAILGV
jgi:sodium-dependent dicarboxylate transporter 2/3/5